MMQILKRVKSGVRFFAFWTIPSVQVYNMRNLAEGNSDGAITLFFFSTLCMIALLVWLALLKGERYIKVKPLWESPLSLLLLLCASPVLLVTAILIRLESPGPTVYKQTRIGVNTRKRARGRLFILESSAEGTGGTGRNYERRKDNLGGRPFTIYKLRSMRNDAELNAGPAWSSGDSDPRITKVGYYIRKTHMDELPQLYNVLRGHMSLIGPRPERPDFIIHLAAIVDGYRDRLNVPPGITGLSQVRKEQDQCLEDVKEKLQNDREYIKNVCLFLDVMIVLKTIILMINLFWSAIRRRTIEKIEPKTPDILFADNSRQGSK